jgi:DUF1365 family protein
MAASASALYVGTVRHRRHRPAVNAFRYGVYHVLIDVDELPRLDAEVRGFGYRRAALTSFHDTDHFGPSDRPVREKLAAWLDHEHGRVLPHGPVRVLTNLRVLGFVFNPVSWWFCHHDDGELAFVVAEVNNTFGESHSYLLDDLERRADGTVRAHGRKVLHVSPFLRTDGYDYRFTFRPPRLAAGEQVVAHIDVHDGHGRVLDATQTERRVALTTTNLRRALWRYPLVTVRTVVLIHRQALRLWRRRVPFVSKPTPPPDGYAPAIPAPEHTEPVPITEEPRT